MNSTSAVALFTSSTTAVGTSGAGARAKTGVVIARMAATPAAASALEAISGLHIMELSAGLNTEGPYLHSRRQPPLGSWIRATTREKFYFHARTGRARTVHAA